MSLLRADARHLPIGSGSVQCCVTSPPYWGLRDYGTATWVGGDAACDHLQRATRGGPGSTLGIGKGQASHEAALRHKDGVGGVSYPSHCGKCGAKRVDAQLGLEATPDAYVANMVAVFRQVHRVLRDDGTLWLNLGDSYAGGQTLGRNDAGRNFTGGGGNRIGSGNPGRQGAHERDSGLKPKDLCGIPWRVAFALQADGWYLRSDIIWSKPNPMPESVTDRPTKAHEYVFLLTKASSYYWDAEAVREPVSPNWKPGAGVLMPEMGAHRIDGITKQTRRAYAEAKGANIRSVWSIATQPYSGAHFATMPEALAERCILAGSKHGDLVLDPFLGSGTVARCAISLGRRAVGTDLNRAYLRLADERTQVTRGLPLELGA